MAWKCGIDGCGSVFEDVESAVVHQATDHQRRECKVCGTIIPDGYLAIRHAFTEHSRAEYVRAYGASSSSSSGARGVARGDRVRRGHANDCHETETITNGGSILCTLSSDVGISEYRCRPASDPVLSVEPTVLFSWR